METRRDALTVHLDHLLEPSRFSDYGPNGLQVEGRATLRHLVTGVTASLALIDAAIAAGADAILVHHGLFWRGQDGRVTGWMKQRLARLLRHDINLYAYHLPLDAHPELGNNAQLARLLDIRITGPLEQDNPRSLVLCGELSQPLSHEAFGALLQQRLGRAPLHCAGGPELIRTVAWCSGGGQGYLELAAKAGIDAFFSGEVSEQTFHVAREMGTHFFAAGHHATERYGIQALGAWLASTQGLDVTFVDIDNPV